MLNKTLFKLATIALAGVLAAAGMVTNPSTAHAAQVNSCTATVVGYDPNRLWFQCAETGTSTTFFAWTSAGGGACGFITDLDTIKVWTSMVQAAFLSGKRMQVGFNAPAGSCTNNAVWEIAVLR